MRALAAILAAAALCLVDYVEQPHDCAIWNVTDGGCLAALCPVEEVTL